MRLVRAYVALVALMTPAVALAQDAPGLRAHRLTVGGAMVRSGSYDIGDATAELRGNGTGAAPAPFTLFQADSYVTSETFPEIKVGFALTRRLAIEAGASVAHPRIGVSIANDAEAPAQELLGEELHQYFFEAAVTWQLPVRFSRRFAPFVSGGGGYLRQLHEDRTLAEGGEIYFAGAGARFWLRGGAGGSLQLGLRGDIRANVRRNGIDFENRSRVFPTVSLGVFLGL